MPQRVLEWVGGYRGKGEIFCKKVRPSPYVPPTTNQNLKSDILLRCLEIALLEFYYVADERQRFLGDVSILVVAQKLY